MEIVEIAEINGNNEESTIGNLVLPIQSKEIPFWAAERTFQKGFIEINGENKNVLEFDVEKDDGIFFLQKTFV